MSQMGSLKKLLNFFFVSLSLISCLILSKSKLLIAISGITFKFSAPSFGFLNRTYLPFSSEYLLPNILKEYSSSLIMQDIRQALFVFMTCELLLTFGIFGVGNGFNHLIVQASQFICLRVILGQTFSLRLQTEWYWWDGDLWTIVLLCRVIKVKCEGLNVVLNQNCHYLYSLSIHH